MYSIMNLVLKIVSALAMSFSLLGTLRAEDAPAAFPAIKGAVSADKLNVRVKAGLGRSVVAILSQGDELEVKAIHGDWLEIAAPKTAAVWVATSNVEGGSLKKGASLRAGPGVAYEAFGVVSTVERITVLDSSQPGWLRIEPPSWLLAYASVKYVALAPADLAKLAARADEAAQGSAEKAPANPEPPAEGDSAKGFTSERSVVVDGILLPVRDNKHLATHALAAEVNGEYHTLCYLKGPNFNLQLWERRKVRIKGVQSWVGDWRRPLVEIELITPVWQ